MNEQTPLAPMLAVAADPSKLRFPMLVSAKLDGIRATVWNRQAYSRKLKLIPNRFIQSQFRKASLPAPFDGELIVGAPEGNDVFGRTTSGVMSHDGEPDFTFWVFDWVPDIVIPFGTRFDMLEKRTTSVQAFNPWVKILHHELVTNLAELSAAEDKAVAQGFEGLMGRSLDGPYKHGRSTTKEGYLLKFKRFAHDEALVIGYIEEMQNTNTASVDELGNTKRSSAKAGMVGKGTLGALQCRRPDGVEFEVGGGFTAEDRRLLWAQRDTLAGRLCRYKHFPVGVKDKPRFPVFAGFRDPRDM